MKVALIDPIGHHGGLHYYTDQLARGLARAHVDVVSYGLAGDSLCTRQSAYPYVQVFGDIYGSAPALLRGLRFCWGVARIFADLIRRRADIVHIHVFQYSVREMLQVVIAKMAGAAIVATIHDVEAFGAEANEFRRSYIMRSTTGIIIHNEYSRKCIPAKFLQGKDFSVIPHMCYLRYVDQSVTQADARRRLGLPEDKTILLFFGNPRHEKGLDIAIDAMVRLKDQPNLMLLTGGRLRPSQEQELRHFVSNNGLSQMVRMDAGVIPDDVAFDYYIASDVVILPYRKIYESGVSIMSASCARPIIASDLPVFVDYTDGGKAGTSLSQRRRG